ncbi:MBL fold metallo-hydrolase, partial [Streptomyces diastatochromogenes]
MSGPAEQQPPAPTDLRLVPPALAAWATAALVLDAPPGWSAGMALACLLAGVVLLSARRWGSPGRPPVRFAWARVPAAAVFLCVAAAATSAGLHGVDVRRGPVPELARRFATVTAEVELTGDPWQSRPRVRGDHAAPVAVLARAEVRRVTEGDGAGVRTRTPVLLVVDANVPAPRAPPTGDVTGVRGMRGADQGWLGLMPSTRLRVNVRLAPAPAAGGPGAAGGGGGAAPAAARGWARGGPRRGRGRRA